MKRICVYCGSGNNIRSVYIDTTIALAEALAQKGIELVYGGGSNGLMGVLADTFLSNGGNVIGVITDALFNVEVFHKGVQDLRVVKTLHERKFMMQELSDGFIALPGGLGTLEEFSEVISWAQLGLHQKPCGLLNVNGYYDELLLFFDKSLQEGFSRIERKKLIVEESDPKMLVDRLLNFVPPRIDLAEEAKKAGKGVTRRKDD